MDNDNKQGEHAHRTTVAVFDDLRDEVTVNLEFERHDGSIMVIPVREIPYRDWLAIEREVPLPSPPRGGADKSGRPWYDTNDPAYIQAFNEAQDRRGYLRVLKALAVDVPGDTVDDKVASIQELPTEIVMTLATYVGQMHARKEARVQARAGTFQP